MDKLSDIELILLLKKSNKKAFAELYLRYYDQLVDYGVRLSNDRFIAEESISELFLYIYEARDRLGIIKIVKSYLYSSYRRLLIRKIIASRKSSSTAIDTNIGDKQIYYSASDLSIDQYGELQKRKALAAALNNLGLRQREAIYLKYYNNLNSIEIAEIMGVTQQTILNTISQALKKLRKDHSFFSINQ